MLSCSDDVTKIRVIFRLCGCKRCKQSKDEQGGMHHEERHRVANDIGLRYNQMGIPKWVEEDSGVTVYLLTHRMLFLPQRMGCRCRCRCKSRSKGKSIARRVMQVQH